MGVATAPAIRYDERIQEEVSYGILNSLMISGIAGNSIVSPYIVISSVKPKIASVIHAVLGIFAELDDIMLLLELRGFPIINVILHKANAMKISFQVVRGGGSSLTTFQIPFLTYFVLYQ